MSSSKTTRKRADKRRSKELRTRADWQRYIRRRIGRNMDDIVRLADLVYQSEDREARINDASLLITKIYACFDDSFQASLSGQGEDFEDDEDGVFAEEETLFEPEDRGNDREEEEDPFDGKADMEIPIDISEPDQIVLGAFSNFWEKRLPLYKPEHPFSSFLVYQLSFSVIEYIREETGYHKLPASYCKDHPEQYRGDLDEPPKLFYGTMNTSFDAPAHNDEGDPVGSLWDSYTDEENTPPQEYQSLQKMFLSADGAQIIGAMLNMKNYFSVRQYNPARINYMHLLFTESVSYSMRRYPRTAKTAFSEHEREYLRQMKPLFLLYTLDLSFPVPKLNEFYLSDEGTYSSIESISDSRVKRYSDLFPGDTEDPLKEPPFESRVLIAYLKECEQTESSPVLISQNRDIYRKFMRNACGD